MRLPNIIILIAAVLLPLTAHARPAKDWSRTVTLTPEGTHLIGNPAAKNRLVEYVSYTCSHCAHFVTEASAPIRAGWISRGGLAVEIRNLVRDRYDLVASLLARCGGPQRFPGNHEAMFGNFPAWMAKVQAYDSAPSTLPEKAGITEVSIDIADKTGLIALMAKRGVSPAQSRACLADEKTRIVVLDMRKRGIEQDRITGTPAFLVNGKLTGVHDWAGLRPLLPAPGN